MRILHVHSGNLFGGVETLLVTLARYRDLCPDMQPAFALCFTGRLVTELTSLGHLPCMLGPVQLRRPWTILRARRRLAARLREETVEALVCHGPWSYLLFGSVARRWRLPLVLWLHGPLHSSYWLDRLALRTLPDHVICNSAFTERSLGCLPRAVGSSVVYCPVGTCPGGADTRDAVRASLGVSPDTVVLAQVGRLEPWKGNREHLKALALLRDLPNWVSWHIGGAQRPHEQRHLQSLRGLVERDGLQRRVRFLGERADVRELLPAADMYVQPNTSAEPFGLAFVEALLAGLPVVTSACGGALEVVNAGCGVLVRPGDTAELARSLRELILDPRRRSQMGAAGARRARALCDPATQLAAIRRALARAGAAA